jgi:hypothetical protein
VTISLGSDGPEPPEGWAKEFNKNLDAYGEEAALGLSRHMIGNHAEREHAPAEGKQAGLLDWIFSTGNPKTVTLHQDPPPKEFPTAGEALRSREEGMPYGSSIAQYVEPGTRPTIQRAKMDELIRNQGVKNLVGKPVVASSEDVERIHRQWLAAERSAVAKLGFDVNHTIDSMEPGRRLTVAGLYNAKTDKMWYDATDISSIVHESMHRGITKLRNAGALPKNMQTSIEEYWVRALMARHFGDIEMGLGEDGDNEVKSAKKYVPDSDLDKLEKAAADLVGSKRGPH